MSGGGGGLSGNGAQSLNKPLEEKQLTVLQRQTLMLYFQRYNIRVSGAEEPPDYMHLSTFMKFLMDADILGQPRSVRFSQARAAFNAYAEVRPNGPAWPTLSFSDWTAA